MAARITGWRRATLLARGAQCALALTVLACQPARYRVVLQYPDAVAFDRARTVEIRIGASLSCEQMQRGLGEQRLLFDAHGASPDIGPVAVGPHAFQATVRDQDCRRFLTACVQATIDPGRATTISLGLIGASETGCASSQRCENARCVAGDGGAGQDRIAVDQIAIDGGSDRLFVDATARDRDDSDAAVDATHADGGGLDGGTPDTGPVDARRTISLGDYSVELAPGWQVEVYRDFTSSFSYPDPLFVDSHTSYHGPTEVFVLPAPFPEGLGVVAGRRLLVLAHPDQYQVQDFTPASVNSTGPDDIAGIRAVASWQGSPAIFLTSGSWNAGDGLYRIDLDWSLHRLNSNNNLHALEVDPAGRFDGLGTPGLYFGGDNDLTRFADDAMIVSDHLVYRCALLQSADLACAVAAAGDFWPMDLVVVRSDTHGHDPPLLSAANNLDLIDGALSRLPHDIYIVVDHAELRALMIAGGSEPIATGSGQAFGWEWLNGVVPPVGHVLGSAPAIYLLENNDVLERRRILRFFY